MTGDHDQNEPAIPGLKWFGQYDPTGGPVAAAELLSNRLERLARCIDKARAEPSSKSIRKLRVATRRADTAARFTLPVAEANAVKRARRALRTLRRAGGAVRRCDVFIGRLQETANAAEGDDVALAAIALIGRLGAERARALQAFVDAITTDRTSTAMAELRVDDAAPTQADELTKALVRDAAAAFAEVAAIPTLDLEALHDLRLRGKRLRYTAEAVAPVVGDSAAAAVIAAVTPMQDELGVINDLAELASELGSFHAQIADLPGAQRLQAGIDRLLLAAASERDRRVIAFAGHRRERIHEITVALNGLKPRPGLRLADEDDQQRSETA